jgi:predicted  nucleic acid-binding Zn-ribbon protein
MRKVQIQSTYRFKAIDNLNDHLRQLDNELDTKLRRKTKIEDEISDLRKRKKDTIGRIKKLGGEIDFKR